jgi:hypothetical protein
MWSNSILDEFPTFQTQYAIELLHSLGPIFDNNYLRNENLRNVMIDLAKRHEESFYQLAYNAYRQLNTNDSVDLLSIFNEEGFNAIKNFLEQIATNPVCHTDRE